MTIATGYISNQPGPATKTQAVDSAIGELHQRIDAWQVTPGFSSLPRGPPSHSGQLDTEFQGLLPKHDEVRNGGQTPLTRHPAETFLLPGGQWQSSP